MKRWLRLRLCRGVLDSLYRERWELAKALMVPDPKWPHGHPHTNGLRDGIQRAIDTIEGSP